MDDTQVEALLSLLRRFGSEDSNLEAKRAHDKLPDSTVESLVALANLRDSR